MADKDWLDKIDFEELIDSVGGDSKLILEHCGRDVLISLLKNLPKVELYISQRLIVEAQKLYVQKYFNGKNYKVLALDIGVSERVVREWISQERAHVAKKRQPELFSS